MEKEKLKSLVHDIYVENRYLFQKYKHEVSHFSRNGIVQEWIQNKYEFKESR